MANGKFVAYFRVSTERQGRSGLGLEAQRAAVDGYLNGGRWTLVGSFTEIESGKNADRPQLAAALSECRVHGATLVIAKLDRLSRDAHFLLGLEKAGVDFIAADMPTANRLTVGIMAMVADEERRAISKRTKEALAIKRQFYAGLTDDQRAELAAAGKATRLGGDRGSFAAVRHLGAAQSVAVRKAKAESRASDLAPRIRAMLARSMTPYAIAKELTAQGVPTPRGKTTWECRQVLNAMAQAGVSASSIGLATTMK